MGDRFPSLAERGGAFLPGLHAQRPPHVPLSCPVAGPMSSFFVRQEGRGDLLLQPCPLCPWPCPASLATGAQGFIYAGQVPFPSPRVSCPRGLLAPPCCGRVRAPGIGVQKCAPRPLWLRGLHGRMLSTLGDMVWEAGVGRRRAGGGAFVPQPPLSVSLLVPAVTQ